MASQLDRVLALIEVPESARAFERPTLRALVDGLTLAICLNGLSTEAAHQASPRTWTGGTVALSTWTALARVIT